jgi:hypothetical protein
MALPPLADSILNPMRLSANFEEKRLVSRLNPKLDQFLADLGVDELGKIVYTYLSMLNL